MSAVTNNPYRVLWGWSYYEDHPTYESAKASADRCAASGKFTGKSYEDRPRVLDLRNKNDVGLPLTVYKTWQD